MELLLIHVFLCVVAKTVKLPVNDKKKNSALYLFQWKFCFLKLPLVENRFHSHRPHM